jgi:hypothetical protein
MEAAAILAIVNGLLQAAFTIWKSAREVLGEKAIPEWSEIMDKNTALQAKIDAAKEE